MKTRQPTRTRLVSEASAAMVATPSKAGRRLLDAISAACVSGSPTERGFQAGCSVCDHLYSAVGPLRPAKPALRGGGDHGALASETKRVRVGCLVFCVCYARRAAREGGGHHRPPERRAL